MLGFFFFNQDPGFPAHRPKWYNSASPDGETACSTLQTKLLAQGLLHMPHGKDIYLSVQLLLGNRNFLIVTSLHADSLNLVNEVTNYPVKSECNIWNTLILLKNSVYLKFDFNRVS